MSLTDIMSEAGLETYAEWGLVLCFAAFGGIVLWTALRPKEEMERNARQALEPEKVSRRTEIGEIGPDGTDEGGGPRQERPIRVGAESGRSTTS